MSETLAGRELDAALDDEASEPNLTPWDDNVRPCPDCGYEDDFYHWGTCPRNARIVEHERLKDAVVEAAKASRQLRLQNTNDPSAYIDALHRTKRAEDKAVDALLQFEAEQESK